MNAERIAELIDYFSEYLSDMEEQDAQLAKEDDPNGLVHPIYMSKLCGPIYRDALTILREKAASLAGQQAGPDCYLASDGVRSATYEMKPDGQPGKLLREIATAPAPQGEDERALKAMENAISDAFLYRFDDDSIGEDRAKAELDDDSRELAHIRARLCQPARGRFSREWIHNLASVMDEDIADNEIRISLHLRSIGVEVEPEEGK